MQGSLTEQGSFDGSAVFTSVSVSFTCLQRAPLPSYPFSPGRAPNAVRSSLDPGHAGPVEKHRGTNNLQILQEVHGLEVKTFAKGLLTKG